ncbi:MAG TPA: hypothetical protein VGK67_00990 [Myxococcales bacterium]|jgi:hypothetical protein
MSRALLALLALVAVLGAVAPAGAAELAYTWKKGSTYRFEAQSRDDVSMGGMGMDLKFAFVTRSRFALTVDAVAKDGTAQGKVVVESFEVKTADGKPVAGLEGLPKDALFSLLEIDRKGRFKLKQRVWVVVDDDGQTLLVSGSASPNSVSASGQAGGEQVTLHASFDPKTGKLAAGYDVKKIAQNKKKIAVTEDKPKVDVLPAQFLALLELPEGPVASGGGAMQLANPNVASGTKVSVEVLELTAERARLKTRVASATQTNTAPADEAAPTEASASAGGDDEGGGMPAATGMGMAIPGMGAMPGMPGAAAPGDAPPMTMGLKVSGDFVTVFDVKAGMLTGLEGTLSTDTNAAGMKMGSRSALKLNRL